MAEPGVVRPHPGRCLQAVPRAHGRRKPTPHAVPAPPAPEPVGARYSCLPVLQQRGLNRTAIQRAEARRWWSGTEEEANHYIGE